MRPKRFATVSLKIDFYHLAIRACVGTVPNPVPPIHTGKSRSSYQLTISSCFDIHTGVGSCDNIIRGECRIGELGLGGGLEHREGIRTKH